MCLGRGLGATRKTGSEELIQRISQMLLGAETIP